MIPADLYERDFYEWTQRNAELLRSGQITEADAIHLAEEIGEIGRRERRALLSRAAVLSAHLLKWQAQPDRRSRSWEATIRVQRRELAKLLADMPSLLPVLRESFEGIYVDAVLLAVADTNLPAETFPSAPVFGVDELVSEDFLP